MVLLLRVLTSWARSMGPWAQMAPVIMFLHGHGFWKLCMKGRAQREVVNMSTHFLSAEMFLSASNSFFDGKMVATIYITRPHELKTTWLHFFVVQTLDVQKAGAERPFLRLTLVYFPNLIPFEKSRARGVQKNIFKQPYLHSPAS